LEEKNCSDGKNISWLSVWTVLSMWLYALFYLLRLNNCHVMKRNMVLCNVMYCIVMLHFIWYIHCDVNYSSNPDNLKGYILLILILFNILCKKDKMLHFQSLTKTDNEFISLIMIFTNSFSELGLSDSASTVLYCTSNVLFCNIPYCMILYHTVL